MNELNNPKRRKPNLADDDSDSHQLKKRKTLERAGHDWSGIDEEAEDKHHSPGLNARKPGTRPPSKQKSYRRNDDEEEEEEIQQPPSEDEMTDTNEDDCFICADGGEILCCDNCFRSFHLDCIQENNPPEGDWVCPYCVKLESKNILLCAESKKPIENDESKIKLKCTKCLRLYC